MFGKLFGRDKKPPFQLAEPMNVTIGRSVDMESSVFKFRTEDSLMQVGGDSLTIDAQGLIDLGEQSWVHRFYPTDESLMLQFQGGDGITNDAVDEISLWYFHDVQYPSDNARWNAMRDAIRAPEYRYAGKVFERAWMEGSSAQEDPISWWETVYDDRSGDNKRRIYQTCMLYGRLLQDEQVELLLVNMEETEAKDGAGAGERCVSFMIGQHLGRHQIFI